MDLKQLMDIAKADDEAGLKGILEGLIKTAVAEETKGLKAKRDEFQDLYSKTKSQVSAMVAAVGASDTEEAQEKISALEELERKHAEDEGDTKTQLKLKDKQHAREMKALERKFNREIADLQKELTAEQKFTRKLVVVNKVEQKLATLDAKTELIEGARAILLGRNPTVKDIDGDRVATVMDADGIEVPFDKWIDEWATSDSGQHYLNAPDTSGGGGGGKRARHQAAEKANPFNERGKPGHNVTEQMRLVREEPELADRLKEQAGWE